ncbi:MAG: repeat-containing protein [Polaromonas sp.]|nr:repeat-containing protein [Polaromonas sp.]
MTAFEVCSKRTAQPLLGCQRIAMTGFLLSMALLLAPAAVRADATETKLVVTATVMKHASLKVLSQPASVTVTAADIRVGYVDVPAPAQVAVQSNTQAGYMLMFESQGEFLQQTLVRGLANDVQVGAAGGGIVQTPGGRGMSKTTLDLGFRFVLSASAQQGTYPWPMRLSVIAL